MSFEPDLEDVSECDTDDIQHDLALGLSFGEDADEPLNKAFFNELVKRNAQVPVNCRMVYNPYGYMKKSLEYDLADPITCKNCHEVIPFWNKAYLVVPYKEGDGMYCQKCTQELGIEIINE